MSELSQAIEQMRNMRESYNDLAGAAEAYNTGKPKLAAAISAMGVPTSTEDDLAEMATKIRQIPQELNTGVSDFEQVIAPNPYVWNVYTVATDLMKETIPSYIPSYMAQYKLRYGSNSFFVGEYYLGYDTLPLTGADGYLTCDGDFYIITGEAGSRIVTHTFPDGTVETYSAEEIIHAWHDSESGRCNRWVAFFYLANAYSFTNITSSICPRRVALCGTCNSFIVSGENRLTDVWVIGMLGHFEGGTTGDTWNPAQVIRNYREHASGDMFANRRLVSVILPDTETITGQLFSVPTTNGQNNFANFISLPKLKTLSRALVLTRESSSCPEFIYLPSLTELNVPIITPISQVSYNRGGRLNIIAESIEKINITSSGGGYSSVRGLLSAYNGSLIGEITIDLSALRQIVSGYILHEFGTYRNNFINVIDIKVGAMETDLNLRYWEATSILGDVTKKAQLIDNIKNHILARVSDATGGTQLVFTVSTNMYNAIASENITWNDQTMTLADAFLTKNWLLAGA